MTGVKVSKVIDLVPHLKTVNTQAFEPLRSHTEVDPLGDAIINLDEKKQKILFHERRQVKRTILTELISSMVVLPEKGLLKVDIHDISEEGISFDVDNVNGHFKVGEEISLRIYLNQKSYFPIRVTIKHVTPELETETIRHGSSFLKNDDNNVALRHFVRFVESASIGLKQDSGDLMVTRTS